MKLKKTLSELVNALSSTTEATLDKIALYEQEGKFNEHLDDVAPDYVPVDGNHVYLTKNPFRRLKEWFLRIFVVNRFCKESNRIFQTEVRGRENLRGVKGAIVCCNHINKLDCMAIRHALKGKRVYTTSAEFNNVRGFLGDMMRVGGLLPMSKNFSAMKNFDRALETLVKRGDAVVFYPERAEWWGYEKPRPLLAGAYRYAVKLNVPLLPIFITFAPTEASKQSRRGLKKFIVNILPPVYPDKTLPARESAERLRQQNARAWQTCYEQSYR